MARELVKKRKQEMDMLSTLVFSTVCKMRKNGNSGFERKRGKKKGDKRTRYLKTEKKKKRGIRKKEKIQTIP